MSISLLRQSYHRQVCQEIMYVDPNGTPKLADKDSKASVKIAAALINRLQLPLAESPKAEQQIGTIFELRTRDFIQSSFGLLSHLRPGNWVFEVEAPEGKQVAVTGRFSRRRVRISEFDQYRHLANLSSILKSNPDLAAILGRDYLVIPDIIVGRRPISDDDINRDGLVVDADSSAARLTPLRARNNVPLKLILHAIISCKWTLRSDRAQQIRFEGLNLIRHRRGHTPHIIAVAAEPLPTRLASLALGTGELDCVYHFALPELKAAVEDVGGEEQLEVLTGMIDGRRLRDISDLPMDLAI